jgi:hypothetical protein
MASAPVYRFHAQLADYEPAIWRRFEVSKNISMAKLAYIVMTLFEMQASHLFSLDVPSGEILLPAMGGQARLYPGVMEKTDSLQDRRYTVKSEDDEDFVDDEDAAAVKLGSIISKPLQQMVFRYDFGDGWHVNLLLEQIYRDAELPGGELPRVLDGAGYGIIEDCGGPAGLEELAQVMKKKKGPRYKELKEWYELDGIDLKSFNLDDMNFRLKKVPGIFKGIYENELSLTQHAMDILTRQYLKKKGWIPV